MQDHDQRFKNLIREFFAEFLQLFFADWAARFDCSQVEWLDKEVSQVLPEPQRRFVTAPSAGAAALTAALSSLLADPELRSTLGAANRARAEERFDRDTMTRAYRELYDAAARRDSG